MQRIVDETFRRGRFVTLLAAASLLTLVGACGTDNGVAPNRDALSKDAGLQKLTEFDAISTFLDGFEFSLYTLDDGGANDDPAQSDLNKFARADNVSGKIGVAWAWDDIDSWTGSGQTGDACALFDIDVTGAAPPDAGLDNADFALCVRITNPDGSAATTTQLPRPASPLLYQCSDKKTDRCTTTFSLVTGWDNPTLRCEVIRTGETTFPTTPPTVGEDGQDVLAACALDLTVLGLQPTEISRVRLLNVCSYPSGSPNSNPFDCVVTPGSGFLRIKKVTQPPGQNENFSFTLTPAAEDDATSYSINASSADPQTALIPVDPRKTYTIEEAAKSGWSLSSVACTGTSGTWTDDKANNKITGISVAVGETKVCTFTNTQPGSITIVKNTEGGDGTFGFTHTVGSNSNPTVASPFNIATTSGTGQQVFSNVAPGTYTVTESAPPSGWQFKSLSCSTGGSNSGQVATINLAAGANVTCTFTNTKQASITIVKNTEGGDGTFSFSHTVGSNSSPVVPTPFDITTASGTGQKLFSNVAPGTYTVTESAPPAGWQFKSLSCSAGGSNAGQVATINLVAGASVTCTYTNTKQGTITIIKNTEGGDGTFSFSHNVGSNSTPVVPTPFDIATASGTGQKVFSNMAPGSYTVTELAPPAGWQFKSLSCTTGGSGSGQVATINLVAGASVTCTFTNTKQGTITIIKNTEGGDDTFAFSHNVGSNSSPVVPTPFDIATASGTGQKGFSNVSPGTYTVTESAPPAGWQFKSLSCTTGGFNAGQVATINLVAGASVTCTFTNTRQGTITIIKNTEGGDGTFSFTHNVGSNSSPVVPTPFDIATTSGTGQKVFSNVSPGTYTVTESGPPTGWQFKSLSCTTGGSDAGQVATINLAAGASVTCTFTNTKQGTITIIKNTEGGNGTFSFTHNVGSNSSPVVPTPFDIATASGTGQKVFSNVAPGTFTVTESGPPAGWQFKSLSCSTGGSNAGQVATINLVAGASVTCTFTNTKQGTITIIKNTVGDNGTFPFTHTVGSNSNPTVGSPFNIATTSGTGQQIFSNVPPGTYTVTEGADPTNWEFTSLGCGTGGSGAGKVATIVLPAGGTITCTYTNTKRNPQLSITKTPDKNLTGYLVKPGNEARFKITVANASGAGIAFGVVIDDVLPADLSWSVASEKGSPGVCSMALDNRTLHCDVGTLAAGADYWVEVKADVPSDFLVNDNSGTTAPLEIDGNLVDDAANGIDWATAGIICATRVGCAIDQPTGNNDDSFGNGTKEDDPVPSIVRGSIPNNKSDLLRFYVAAQRVGTDDHLYLAWQRVQEPSGTTNMDFELNQSKTLSSNGVTPVRTKNDVLIRYDLSQGGVNPVLGYHLWVTDGGTAAMLCEAANKLPCWGKRQSLSNDVDADINTGSVTDDIAPGNPRSLSARTFGEARINLKNSGIFTDGLCTVFGSAYLKSRSSDSFTAAVKDFIAPLPINVSNCQSKLLKNTALASATNFTPTGGTPGGSISDKGLICVTYTLDGSDCPAEETSTAMMNQPGVSGGWSNVFAIGEARPADRVGFVLEAFNAGGIPWSPRKVRGGSLPR